MSRKRQAKKQQQGNKTFIEDEVERWVKEAEKYSGHLAAVNCLQCTHLYGEIDWDALKRDGPKALESQDNFIVGCSMGVFCYPWYRLDPKATGANAQHEIEGEDRLNDCLNTALICDHYEQTVPF